MKLSPNTIFISLFFVMVFAGFAFPQLGPILKPFIAFLAGLTIFLSMITQRMEKIISSVFELRKIIIGLFFAFAIMPVICFFIAKTFFKNSPGLAIGLIVMGAVPCSKGCNNVDRNHKGKQFSCLDSCRGFAMCKCRDNAFFDFIFRRHHR
nr:hypothetical protein BSM_34140 [uncultured archaeon]